MAAAGGSLVQRIADWVVDLDRASIPDAVVRLSLAQQRSVLGGVAASAEDGAARRVLEGVAAYAGAGGAPMFGRPDTCAVDDALYAATALSVALDFDDYMCFGHSGHSAVLVPLLLAGETGASAEQQLVAQVAANEIEARLGGACLLGPLNGQMWSFIHSAGAALALCRLMGLDRRACAHALALSLYQAPRPTVAGFMSPDSKLLTVAEPAVMGLRAARLAAAGVTGPLDALDDRHGFLGAFTYAPVRGMFGELGRSWATYTLCVKPYPGCAYIDTTIDALLSLGPLDPEEIESIRVDAGILTCGMDALSARYSRQSPTPVTVNFSIPLNVAIAVVAGRLTPDEVNEKWLVDHREPLRDIAGRVTLCHDPALTLRSLRRLTRLVPLGAVRKEVGARRLVTAARRMRADHPKVPLHAREVVEGLRTLSRGRNRSEAPTGFWDEQALEEFVMSFPARVRVRLRSGREIVAEAESPRGGAGNAGDPPESIARAKFDAWAPRLWGVEGAAAIDAAVESGSDDIYSLVAGRS